MAGFALSLSFDGALREAVSFSRCAGLGVERGLVGISLGGSLGAVRTFHSGLALGVVLPREAEMLMKSWSKKISNEMFGIWKSRGGFLDLSCRNLIGESQGSENDRRSTVLL
jgi:hypothetical protein